MYIIVLGIFIIKLQISVSDLQFPVHVDFQKVGETIFNNEKFNILKTTTHVITDHFKEFMLRSGSENSINPAKRVFIDTNGFRHEWSGFGETIKSLRKTDFKHLRGSFEVASEDTLKSGTIATNETVNTTDTVKDSSENNEDGKNNATDNNNNNVAVQHLTEEANETNINDTASTTTSVAPTRVKDSSDEITIEERLRNGKKDNETPAKAEEKKADADKTPAKADANKTPAKAEEKKADANKTPAKAEEKKADADKTPAKADANKTPAKAEEKKDDANKTPAKAEEKKDDKTSTKEEKTVMQTTFFCPYLGVITMSRFIDL